MLPRKVKKPMDTRTLRTVTVIALLAAATACAPRQAKVPPSPQPAPDPVADVIPAPTSKPTPPPTTPAPQVARAERVEDVQPVVPRVSEADAIAARSLDDLNRDSLLKPAFFPLDSSDLDDAGRAIVSANADILKKYPSWAITVEGHADERGTAEYNLALGERRAASVRAYLVSLGIPDARLRVISYGKEFPFDPGHNEAAWQANRRAHFVITAK